jgi:hypothetical protein
MATKQYNTDRLLDLVFADDNIWENAITKGDEKNIRQHILENFSDPNVRQALKEQIKDRKYHISAPHEARIPKDDGSLRTVYVNKSNDRILLTVINNIFFKYCGHMIHKSCMSYQTGIGCGKIVKKVVKDINHIGVNKSGFIGYKIDLSKYFDSVPIEYIDKVFDELESYFGESTILDLVREYYHDDTLLDINKKEIHKYTSLRQGCAIAAFLANSVLYDIDKTMSEMDVIYYRYSDDILILGPNAENAFIKINELLDAKTLTLNPKKVERLDGNHWFTFLGFSIKGDKITLSKKRVKNLQKAIEQRSIKSKNKNNCSKIALHRIYQYLYDTTYTKFGYAEGILPIVNCTNDLKELDRFITSCVIACDTKKYKIGGLGYNKTGKDGVIVRGKGRNIAMNNFKAPALDNYTSLSHMQILFKQNRTVYETYVKDMMS